MDSPFTTPERYINSIAVCVCEDEGGKETKQGHALLSTSASSVSGGVFRVFQETSRSAACADS